IYLNQSFAGLRVANAVMNINITADGRVINVGSDFVPNLSSMQVPTPTTAHILASEAIVAAGTALGLQASSSPQMLNSNSDNGTMFFSASELSLDDIPAR